jgi:uncharacterized RDD family membrane protein YckC
MDPISPGAEPSRCSNCGIPYPESELITYGDAKICASCKQAFFQKLKEGAALPVGFAYAGFWIRFGAQIVDYIILYIVNMAIFLAFEMPFFGPPEPNALGLYWLLVLLQYAIAIGYETVFIGKFGATPGKMACRIKVVNPDGSRVSYMKALGRVFGKFLSGVILCIGYLMVGFDDEKRALHDRVCNTRVILNRKA